MRSKGRAGPPSSIATVTLAGVEYVVLPRAEYLRLVGVPAGSVDALTYGRASLGESLRAAREVAGLTQGDLAAKLGKSQTLVSRAEAGDVRVGDLYVVAVLKACGLPEDWTPVRRSTSRASSRP